MKNKLIVPLMTSLLITSIGGSVNVNAEKITPKPILIESFKGLSIGHNAYAGKITNITNGKDGFSLEIERGGEKANVMCSLLYKCEYSSEDYKKFKKGVEVIVGASEVKETSPLQIKAKYVELDKKVTIMPISHEEEALSLEKISGKITHVNKVKDGYYVILDTKTDGEVAVVVPFKTSDGIKVNGNISDIKLGNNLSFKTTGAATMSLPPIFFIKEVTIHGKNSKNSQYFTEEFHTSGVIENVSKVEGNDYYMVRIKTENDVVLITVYTENTDDFELNGDIKNLKKGAKIDFYHDGISTRSLPPIYTALKVNIGDKVNVLSLSENDKNLLNHFKKTIDKNNQEKVKKWINKIEKITLKMDKKQKLVTLNSLIEQIENLMQEKFELVYPQDIPMPEKASKAYNMLWMLQLELQKSAFGLE